ncbi:Uncharacterised protein [Vibrio cholerae]|nr:Uncharacterised protein [Vibrio cholerae]
MRSVANALWRCAWDKCVRSSITLLCCLVPLPRLQVTSFYKTNHCGSACPFCSVCRW